MGSRSDQSICRHEGDKSAVWAHEWAVQKWVKRSRYRLRANSCEPKKPFLCRVKFGRIHSPREGWQDLLSRSTPATMLKQHCRMLQCRMLFRHCCPKRQHCRSSRQRNCLLHRQCCFDIVASVDRALQLQSLMKYRRTDVRTWLTLTMQWGRDERLLWTMVAWLWTQTQPPPFAKNR